MSQGTDETVIRKMSIFEWMFDQEFINSNGLIQTRVLLVELKQGEITLDLLKKACVYSVKHLPLLGAEIRRAETESMFVPMDSETAFNFDKNVQLVEADDPTEWERIMDQEFQTSFDKNKGHLWRLKVLRITNSSLDYNHAVVFTTQHSITDGRNSVEILRRLLNIIGSLILGQTCVEMQEGNVVHSKFNTTDLIEQKHKLDPTFFPMPKLDRDSRISKFFVDEDAEPASKFQHFLVPAEKVNKLIKKMKENAKEAKMTGVFSMIACLAYKNLFKKHNVTDIPTDKIQFSLMGSLRDKLGVESAQMGAFLTGYERALSEEDTKVLDLNTIWSLAEKESLDLHQLIKSDFDYDFALFLKENLIALIQMSPDAITDVNYNFKLSNYGPLKNTDVPDVIKIRQHYVRTLNIYGRHGANFLMSLCTIDGNLCWTCTHNEKLQSSKFVSELIVELNNIIDKLID